MVSPKEGQVTFLSSPKVSFIDLPVLLKNPGLSLFFGVGLPFVGVV